MKDLLIRTKVIRAITQYLPFPMAITRKTYSRFFYAYGRDGFLETIKDPNARGTMHGLAWLASMITFGYFATVIKDMLRGREPIHFGNLNSLHLGRILAQSGVAGILGNFLEGPEGMLAPLPTHLIRATMAASQGEGARFVSQVEGAFPGASIPLFREVRIKLLAMILGDSIVEYQSYFLNRIRFIEGEHGLNQNQIIDEDMLSNN